MMVLRIITPCISLICALSATSQAEKRICPVGWERNTEYCYKFIKDTGLTTFNDAMNLCTSEGAGLSYVSNKITNDFLARQLVKHNVDKCILAVADQLYEGHFRWPDNTALLFSDWVEGDDVKPPQASVLENNTEQLDCITVNQHGAWENVACDGPTQEMVVCQKAARTGKVCDLNGQYIEL